MLRSKMLLGCVVSAVVLTSAGSGLTKKPNTNGPVQELDYDVTTDVVLGLPNGASPLSSFQGALAKGVAQPANLVKYPPVPCAGVAAVWNAILAEKTKHGGHGDHGDGDGNGDGEHGCSSSDAQRTALGITLQVMATYQCSLQIVRDESTNPPTIVSITPISSF
jgi:hypothetical protein